MYRTLIPLLLCASTVLSAPQQNSNITYVKRQINPEASPPDLKLSKRESRIEKVPLTIPANVDNEPSKKNNENTRAAQSNNSQPIYNYSDRIYSIKTKPKTTSTTEKTPKATSTTENSSREPEDTEKKNSDESVTTEDSDIVPAESKNTDRLATNDNTDLSSELDATQTDELVTENYEESTLTTIVEEATTKASIKLPKLSYFGKSAKGSFSQNLIANAGKRRFRSRCRCEKIWNCPKLQISVPRCPEEYFMCCS